MCIGDQGDLGRDHFENQVDEFIDWIAFDVQFGCDDLFQIANVLIADMTLIGAWVYGDALRTEPFCIERCLYHIGNIPSARVA